MPHAQQLMMRTQARKGDIVEPEGVTLDDLAMTDSPGATLMRPPTTPNSTELQSFPIPFATKSKEKQTTQETAPIATEINENQQTVPGTVEETSNDKAELIKDDESSDSDDKNSATPLEPGN